MVKMFSLAIPFSAKWVGAAYPQDAVHGEGPG